MEKEDGERGWIIERRIESWKKGKTTHLRVWVMVWRRRGCGELFSEKKKSENLTGRAQEERNRVLERIEPRRSFIFMLGACGNNDGIHIYISTTLESFHRFVARV